MALDEFYSLKKREGQPWPDQVDLDFVEITGSTNDDLKKRLRIQKITCPIGRVAVTQSAGRGTRGRVWKSSQGGFYFSLALLQKNIRPSLTLIPLAVGWGVSNVLRQYGIDAYMKWPNDIWINGGKAGGILCELVKDPEGRSNIVIGVGINYYDIPEKTTNGWPIRGIGEDQRFATPDERTDLIAALIVGILDTLLEDNEKIVCAWHEVNAFQGKNIALETENDRIVGQVIGIDVAGRLVLSTKNGVQAFLTGSISPYDDSLN